VPQECLILTMKANQKYFPLLDADEQADQPLPGRQQHQPARHPARWSAATSGWCARAWPMRKFFFDQDRKKTLESRVDGLNKVVYHNKLGSQGERMPSACAPLPTPSSTSCGALPYTATGQGPLRCSTARRIQRRIAGQDRSADRHGRRISRAARHHGRLLRPPRRPARRRGHCHRRPLQAALCRRQPCRATTLGTGVGPGRQARNPGRDVRHRPTCPPATRIRSPCAAMRWV
jgi:hypothetical protein